MRARALSFPSELPEPCGHADWKTVASAWLVFVALVLAVSGIVAVVAPDWLPAGRRELPDSPGLIADIFANNLLIALLPLLGGWLAAGYSLGGHRFLARLSLFAPTLIVARSLITIGAVGGADPAWLAGATRWWLLELAALAASSCTGLWLARNPELREHCGPRAMRAGLAIVVVSLALGAVVEVLTA